MNRSCQWHHILIKIKTGISDYLTPTSYAVPSSHIEPLTLKKTLRSAYKFKQLLNSHQPTMCSKFFLKKDKSVTFLKFSQFSRYGFFHGAHGQKNQNIDRSSKTWKSGTYWKLRRFLSVGWLPNSCCSFSLKEDLFSFPSPAFAAVPVTQFLHFQTTLWGKESDPLNSTCRDFSCLIHIPLATEVQDFIVIHANRVEFRGKRFHLSIPCHSSALRVSSSTIHSSPPQLATSFSKEALWEEAQHKLQQGGGCSERVD